MMQRIKPHLALAVILASVWALLAAVEFAFVGGWEGAVLQGFLVFAVGLPLFLALFLVVLNWAPARGTDWDAELARLLEEMDR
jgi:hypothetical protein